MWKLKNNKMKVKEVIISNREKKTVSCEIDTDYTTERETSITIWPDAKLSIGNKGNIHNYNQGLNILITCRHNGTIDDMIMAFEDARNLLVASKIT
jgi:hypothetical protein